MAKKVVSEDMMEQAFTLYSEGATVAVACQETGVPHRNIGYWRKKLGYHDRWAAVTKARARARALEKGKEVKEVKEVKKVKEVKEGEKDETVTKPEKIGKSTDKEVVDGFSEGGVSTSGVSSDLEAASTPKKKATASDVSAAEREDVDQSRASGVFASSRWLWLVGIVAVVGLGMYAWKRHRDKGKEKEDGHGSLSDAYRYEEG